MIVKIDLQNYLQSTQIFNRLNYYKIIQNRGMHNEYRNKDNDGPKLFSYKRYLRC